MTARTRQFATCIEHACNYSEYVDEKGRVIAIPQDHKETSNMTHTTRRNWEAVDAAIVARAFSPARVQFLIEDAIADIADLTQIKDELLAALELLRSFVCPRCNGDCGSANPPVMTCPMQVASKAIAKARGSVMTRAQESSDAIKNGETK